eukprot:g2551.t1
MRQLGLAAGLTAFLTAATGSCFEAANRTTIKVIYLNDNAISTLARDVFQDLEALEALSLPVGLFDGLKALEQLDLHDNELGSLTAGLFGEDLTALRLLDLRENSMEKLPEGIFEKLPSLSRLNLSANKIASLSVGHFPANLEFLFLTNNDLGTGTIDPGAFEGLRDLRELTLSDNDLVTLPAGLFKDLGSLTVLGLGGNSELQCVPSTAGSPSLATNKIVLPTSFVGGVCSCPEDTVCDDCVGGELGYICTGCEEKAKQCLLDRTCQECRIPANQQEKASWDACISAYAFRATCSALSATACCFDELSGNSCLLNHAFVEYSTCLVSAMSENGVAAQESSSSRIKDCEDEREDCQDDATCLECFSVITPATRDAWETCLSSVSTDDACVANAATLCCYDKVSHLDCMSNSAFVDYYSCGITSQTGEECDISCDLASASTDDDTNDETDDDGSEHEHESSGTADSMDPTPSPSTGGFDPTLAPATRDTPEAVSDEATRQPTTASDTSDSTTEGTGVIQLPSESEGEGYGYSGDGESTGYGYSGDGESTGYGYSGDGGSTGYGGSDADGESYGYGGSDADGESYGYGGGEGESTTTAYSYGESGSGAYGEGEGGTDSEGESGSYGEGEGGTGLTSGVTPAPSLAFPTSSATDDGGTATTSMPLAAGIGGGAAFTSSPTVAPTVVFATYSPSAAAASGVGVTEAPTAGSRDLQFTPSPSAAASAGGTSSSGGGGLVSVGPTAAPSGTTPTVTSGGGRKDVSGGVFAGAFVAVLCFAVPALS